MGNAKTDKFGFTIPYVAHDVQEHDLSSGDLDIDTTGKPFIFKSNTDDGNYSVITYQAYFLNNKTLDDSLAVNLYSCRQGEWQMTPLAKISTNGTETEVINYSVL